MITVVLKGLTPDLGFSSIENTYARKHENTPKPFRPFRARLENIDFGKAVEMLSRWQLVDHPDGIPLARNSSDSSRNTLIDPMESPDPIGVGR